MRKPKSKPFDTDILNERFNQMKEQRDNVLLKELENSARMEIDKKNQKKAFLRNNNRSIDKLISLIENEKIKQAEYSSSYVPNKKPGEVTFLSSHSKTMYRAITNKIRSYENSIENIRKKEFIYKPTQKYSKKESNIVTCTCINDGTVFKTYKSLLEKHSIRYSMCPSCRKKKPQKLTQKELEDKNEKIRVAELKKSIRENDRIKELKKKSQSLLEKYINSKK